MGGAKGWAVGPRPTPGFQKTCELNTIALLCGTVAATPKVFLSCGPTPVGTIAPPMHETHDWMTSMWRPCCHTKDERSVDKECKALLEEFISTLTQQWH
jgi:hypothetical protein